MQGKYVPRMWLSSLLAGVNQSIHYDWKNDGWSVDDCESNFGANEQNFTGNPAAPFTPKPAYRAALAAQSTIGNASALVARLPPASVAPAGVAPASIFVLQFSGGVGLGASAGGNSLAVWTNATTCAAQPAARVPCGGAGATELDCLSLGCCYDDAAAADGTTACYATPAAAPPPSPPTCDAAGAQRVDCGFDGIGYNECVTTRGCCWDAARQPDGPQCFFHDGDSPGFVNITLTLPPSIPASSCWSVTDTFGFARGRVCAIAGTLSLAATDGPQYLY